MAITSSSGVAFDEISRLRKLQNENEARHAAEAAEFDDLPSIASLCLSRPLYDSLKTSNRIFLKKLRGEQVQFDAYCVECGSQSIFKDKISRGSGAGTAAKDDWMEVTGQFNIIVHCLRADHIYTFSFDYRNSNLTKFGQMPSLEDIAGHDIKKYAPLLRDGYFQDLKRATGLASHGIGIGSFVYLRRIFEKLINDHHAILEKKGDGVENFSSLRMEDKIGSLNNVLPPALVKNKATYSILSSGIHALDEETCRRYFPVVRAAIIEILEQDLRAQEQEKSRIALENEISKLAGEIKNS